MLNRTQRRITGKTGTFAESMGHAPKMLQFQSWNLIENCYTTDTSNATKYTIQRRTRPEGREARFSRGKCARLRIERSGVEPLVGDIVLCSWARHVTLAVPLSIQVYKWIPANLMLGVTLRWTGIPSRGEKKYC